jgi:hypothetical protein
MTDPDLRNLACRRRCSRIEQRMYGGLGARTDAGRAMEEIIRRLREHEAAEAASRRSPGRTRQSCCGRGSTCGGWRRG